MGKPPPAWKGKFVDREWLREKLEGGFRRMATGDFDEQLGRLVNEIELYVASKVLENSREALQMVLNDVKGALDTLAEMEKLVGREEIRRTGMEDEDDSDR